MVERACRINKPSAPGWHYYPDHTHFIAKTFHRWVFESQDITLILNMRASNYRTCYCNLNPNIRVICKYKGETIIDRFQSKHEVRVYRILPVLGDSRARNLAWAELAQAYHIIGQKEAENKYRGEGHE